MELPHSLQGVSTKHHAISHFKWSPTSIVWLLGLIYELFFATPCKRPHILVLGWEWCILGTFEYKRFHILYNVCTVSRKWVDFDELLVISNQTTTQKVFMKVYRLAIEREWCFFQTVIIWCQVPTHYISTLQVSDFVIHKSLKWVIMKG